MRILIVAPQMPFPPRDGGSIRIYHLIRQLAQAHEISLAVLATDPSRHPGGALDSLCRETVCIGRPRPPALKWMQALLAPLRRAPYLATVHQSAEVRRVLDGLAARMDAIQFEFPYTASITPRMRDRLVVIDAHNVESEILRQQYRLRRPGPRRYFDRQQYHRMQRLEAHVYPRADFVLATSAQDREKLRAHNRRTVVIPSGIDLSSGSAPLVGANLLFAGLMSYPANEDAVLYFCRRIWPRVKSRVPHARFVIAGRNPSRRLQRQRRSDVIVTGSRPDLTPWFRDAACFVAPLRMGSGTRLKILEAMSHGLPVVATTIGAQGLDLIDGKDILLADDAAAFSRRIVRMLTSTAERHRIGRNARQTVMRRFRWNQIGRRLREVYAKSNQSDRHHIE